LISACCCRPTVKESFNWCRKYSHQSELKFPFDFKRKINDN
jgi:hypothetical protein